VTYGDFNRESWRWGGMGKLTFQPTKSLRIAVNGNATEFFQNTRANGIYYAVRLHLHRQSVGQL